MGAFSELLKNSEPDWSNRKLEQSSLSFSMTLWVGCSCKMITVSCLSHLKKMKFSIS